MSKAPKGIANLGNTCFLNASLQVLCRMSSFTEFVLTKEIVNPSRQEQLLLSNFKEVLTLLKDSNGLLSPRGVLHAVQSISNDFPENEPADIAEFLLFFIQSIHSCFAKTKKVTYSGIPQNAVDNMAIACYQLLVKTFENYSELMDIFQGVYVSRITSQTEMKDHPELFFILDLPIPSKPSINIYDCLDLFVAPETLDGENAWRNAKGRLEAIEKQLLFWSFPPILIICLKRFSQDGSKNSAFIAFPQELDLRPYTSGYRASEYEYELQGVCNHIGNKDGGHYTSFVKEDQWFHCDDEVIQEVNEPNQVITSTAYCLIYQKKNISR